MTDLEQIVTNMGPAATVAWVKANCTRVLSMHTVFEAIKAVIPPSQTYQRYQTDTLAHYVPAEYLTQLAACTSNSPVQSAYIAEYLDCDDYALAFKGWLSRVGLGALTIGLCSFVGYDANDRALGKHMLIVAVDPTNKVHFIEPQDGTLRDPRTHFWPGAPATAYRKELMFVMF